MSKPIVTIIGRPNVGKSTLFNRLVGKKIAIEAPIPGTTRDQIFGDVFWEDKTFTLTDVAGIDNMATDGLSLAIKASIESAIESSDLILFIVDWNEPENDRDKYIARLIRKSGKKTIMAINKADNINRITSTEKFDRFGFESIAVSGISGKNTGDLLEKVIANLDFSKAEEVEEDRNLVKLAIVGRPNVGKSTLLNAILGHKRAIVSDIPGTTRDIIDVTFKYQDKKIQLVDTAGLRRPGKIGWDTIEKYSTIRTAKALRDADVVIVVIDQAEGLVANDTHILGDAINAGKGIVLAINKMDLIDEKIRPQRMAQIVEYLQTKLNFAPWLPAVFISAKDENNIDPLIKQALKVWQNRNFTIPEADLNEILQLSKNANPQLDSITMLTQTKTTPPEFRAKYKGREPHFSQLRYLENKIRDVYPLEGTPIFIDLFTRGK